ncbi:MAG: polyphosphate kinase [Blastocatellia bacterium]|jgi:polyphosphate kinase|nr:polyphosphate kinase [Blastocatellia bacterium]
MNHMSKVNTDSDNLRHLPGPSLRTRPVRVEDYLFNREVSQVEFFRRVLEEALDESQPLLERLKFLAIFSSNVDEFFMIRVSALKEAMEEDVHALSPDGLTPGEQLAKIRELLVPLVAEHGRCLQEDVIPRLKANGIEISAYDALSDQERNALDEYFRENVFPVLTPQAVDPSHPFPYISNQSLNLGLMVQEDERPDADISSQMQAEPRFVRIKVPPLVPRMVAVPGTQAKFVLLGELIKANLNSLFPGMSPSEAYTFRLTRDADIDIREDEADDLLHTLQEQLRRRRFGTPVRLEVSSAMPDELVQYLSESIGLAPDEVYTIDGPLNVPDLMALYDLPRADLKDKPLPILMPDAFRHGSEIFEAIKEHDLLLHHPYVSYTSITDLIAVAANDPLVVAIKICVYRTGGDSPILPALIQASEQGKQVTVLIELKARFDEEKNIEWATRLERAGIHVVYGVMGLKTHCKLALIIRREGERLQRYVHIATGNYNPTTSTTYTDLGLLTANEDIGADATELFNYLTGYSRQNQYQELLVAPVNLRDRMTALIEREIEHQRAGRPARIIGKINRIADTRIIGKFYEASQAGVPTDLIVRGICMLRPGIPGLSETITVRSIVGRFLEHSRVFYFANGGEDEVYVGSSDLMPRNLNRRVEVLSQVHDARLKTYLRDVVLETYLRDNVKARQLRPDGSYEKIPVAADEPRINSQVDFAATIGKLFEATSSS